ncbi:MAG: hypothetical protein WAV95_17375 [Azonexus sp.]
MILQRRFSDQQLEQIIEEATIYMCACPGQVAVQLRSLRELYRYQGDCEIEPGNDQVVHQTIAAATAQAYAVMEDCLEQGAEHRGLGQKYPANAGRLAAQAGRDARQGRLKQRRTYIL